MPFYFARKAKPEAEPQPTRAGHSDSTAVQPNGSSHVQGSHSQGNNSNNSSSQTIAHHPEPEPETDSDSEGEECSKALIHVHTNPGSVDSLSSLSRYLTNLLKFHRKQQRRANSRKPNHNPDPDPAPSRSGEELNIYLSPFTEGVLINFKKLIVENRYTEDDVPLIMYDITTVFLPEGPKWATSIRKLQEMQLEWFDLRFGEYANFTGLSAESHARRENLGRLSGRKDAIFVDGVWLDHQPEPLVWESNPRSKSAGKLPATDQPESLDWKSDSQTSMTQFTQALFDRSSWETINSILEREELDKDSLPRQVVKPEGPMTTLIQLLADHTNDILPNVRSIISDYVTRRRQSHLQNQLSLKDLIRERHYYDFAGRLAADLAMTDHLPQAIDKGWQSLLHDKIRRIIKYHFKQFDVHSITGALLTYSPRLPNEHPKPPGPYWRGAHQRPTGVHFDISAEDEVDAVTGRFHGPRSIFGASNIWQTRGGPNVSEQPSTGGRIFRENGYTTRQGRIRPAWPAWSTLTRQPTTPLQSSAQPVLGSQESTPRQKPEEVIASGSQQSTPKQRPKEVISVPTERNEEIRKGKEPSNSK